MNKDFKKLVSYNRFVELKKLSVVPLALFFKLYGVANCTGISFIDSMSLKVCHIKRKSSNKVFKNIAKKGKTSEGIQLIHKLRSNMKNKLLSFQDKLLEKTWYY